MKKQRGITLISLVVTIIVLIILAGVAINLTIGENGLLRKAQFARDEYNNAVGTEGHELNELYAYLTRDDLPENTPENPQDAGTIVKLPDNWQTVTPNYVSLDDGSIVTASTKVATVYAVSVGAGNTVPIPKDFYYVGGNLDTGVVISDKYEDSYENNKRDMTGHSDAINLIGNQFVWIPCTASEYKKSNWSSDGEKQGNVTGVSNCYWGTEVNTLEVAQIKKYGGFYVGRYEAGLPVGTTEFTGSLSREDDEYNMSGIPQSKAGVSPWNFIDWNNATANANKMYETKTNVTSGLITGTGWDVMLNKIGSLKDSSGNTKYSLTDSKTWGNYYKGEAFNFTGRAAEYKNSSLYAFGEVKTNETKANNTYYLLSTGASEHNKAYNLYDVAGNLWEWTNDNVAYYNSIGTLTTNRMNRGGGYTNASSEYPACFYDGGSEATLTNHGVGFRVVLYIQ